MRKRVLVGGLAAALAGCSAVNRAAVRSTANVLSLGRVASLEEPDYQLAREAISSQLKLIETLLMSDPDNRALRRLAAEGFGGAAFLFLEDSEPERAKGLYMRGRDHALAALALRPPFRGLADKPADEFEKSLKSATGADVPELFWAGFCWAGYVNLSKDDASALADLPKVVALMRRVSALDPGYHFDGTDLFFGVYYASRPRLLGGDPQKAKASFERAVLFTKGRYLTAPLLEARWYAVAVQDRDLFKALLTKVVESPPGQLPEARLTDEAARRKAAALLAKIDDYF